MRTQMRQQALQTGLTLCGQGAAGHKRCSTEGSGKLQTLPPCYLAAVLFCRCRGEGMSLVTQQGSALSNTRKDYLLSICKIPLVVACMLLSAAALPAGSAGAMHCLLSLNMKGQDSDCMKEPPGCMQH